MSNYTTLVVPAKGVGNENTVMVKIESRHVAKVPQEGDEEVAFDTSIDPKVYDDHVTLAANVARWIANGRKYESIRHSICEKLSEIEDIVFDLENDMVTANTRAVLYEGCIDKIHAIGKMIDFNMEDRKEVYGKQD